MKTIIVSLLSVVFISDAVFAISCKRNLSIISSKEMKIEITVDKQDVSGFAKLAELIPDGAVIKYAKSEGGSVDIANNKMNFFWLNLPQANEVRVTYILNTEKLNEGDYSVAGKFSYVADNAPRSVAIDPSTFSVSAAKGVSLEPLSAVVSENAAAGATEKTDKIVYGVQVISTAKALPDNYFAKNYSLNEKVKIKDNTKGQFKYVIGEFNHLESALSYRETLIGKGLKDSFVVAFLNDKEISLNEAKAREGSFK